MTRLVWFVAGILSFVATLAVANAESIGQAESAKKEVTGILGSLVRSIATGDSVSGNETIRTGASSAALLRFIDSSNLTIGESSTVRLDRFVFNPDQSASSAVVRLGKGAMRFVSKGGSEPKHLNIETSVATLGIRGTDFVALCDGIQHCAVLMTLGKVLVCPHRKIEPLECPDAYGLDQDWNFTLIGPQGRNTGPGRIDPSIVAAITAAIANGDPLPSLTQLAALSSVDFDGIFGPRTGSVESGKSSASPQ